MVSVTTAQGHDGAADRPGTLALWVGALRPKTLPAGAAPVIVGVAVAAIGGTVSPTLALLCLLGALSLQVVSNLANDLFDHLNGADTEARLGPARATAQGWVTPRQMGIATIAAGLLSVTIGGVLVSHAGWPVLAMGLSGLIAAIAYTAGPRPLGYMGLGDPLVFLFFGPVAVCGTVFVLRGSVGLEAWAAALPMGLLSTAILVVNNLRDLEEDKASGKRTLAVRLGASGARMEILVLVGSAYALPIMGVLRGGLGIGWLLPLLTLPMGLARVRSARSLAGQRLNPEIAAMARLLLAYGLCLAVGVLL
jgi:1,4-dihydroxy-2-naphthoate octaprenyltransferase